MIFSPDILRNKIHRTGTIQGNACNNILQTLRLQLLHEILHTRTFQLEHTICLTGSQRIQHCFIIVINMIHINLTAMSLLGHPHSILDHSQGTKPQEIHLQKSKFFQCGHGKLSSQ